MPSDGWRAVARYLGRVAQPLIRGDLACHSRQVRYGGDTAVCRTAKDVEVPVVSQRDIVRYFRGRHDARIYTNDPEQLVHALSRDVSRQSALRPDQAQTPTAAPRQEAKPEVTP